MRRAFTLIELLVVVTVIVVLLALLVPAMDKAIYQAELMSCGTRQKTIASGSSLYAVDYKRHYPLRPIVTGGWLTTDLLYNGADDRSVIRNHISVKAFVDPLVNEVDLSSTVSSRVQSSFTSFWAGSKYAGHKGMAKLGDRFTWTDNTDAANPKAYAFNLLASDSDYRTDQNGTVYYASHADTKGTMQNPYASADFTFSYWQVVGGITRGTLDMNFAYADGSVERLYEVKTNNGTAEEEDERVVRVPLLYNASSSATWYQQVAKGQLR